MDKVKLELTHNEAAIVSIAILCYQINVDADLKLGENKDILLAKNNNERLNAVLDKITKAVTSNA
jgi:hypothetical protein